MTLPSKKRAHVVGLGLIGSSVALALQETGWEVTGEDLVANVVAEAVEHGVVVRESSTPCQMVIIATPASAVVRAARENLARWSDDELIVTDVAGVKGAIADDIDDPRFIGGHPMAGSELRGLAGARADLFQGATWVLTPTSRTTAERYAVLHGILRDVGANVVAIDGHNHDRLMAMASHVPHLVAGALMNEAATIAEPDPVLLQLAAGGFRDMTRIAAGDPAIWPDVLFENSEAIAATLTALVSRLEGLKKALQSGDRRMVSENLATASQARRELPGRGVSAQDLAFLRVAISDQPGSLAKITTAASELAINIYDIEIAHDIGLASGVLLLTVDVHRADEMVERLAVMNFRVGRQ